MDQEKFGKFIKELRKKHNLTQKEFADKYNLTYQAVSKWENGKNMPDTLLIKQISKDFNVSLEELFDGEYKLEKEEEINNKKNNLFFILFILIILFLFIFIILDFTNHNDFEFKTLTTTCDNFNISGNISYSDSKSAIYITNIKYCGGNDTEEYKKIECILYESNNDIDKKISSYVYNKDEYITLENFLEEVTFSVDNYEKTCKVYKDDTLFLNILATDKNNKVITYRIPLKLENTCNN